MWAVFKKEWQGNFRTLTGWIFLAVTIFFLGWYFNYFGLNSGLPYVSYIISAVQFIFLFTLPLLTMRSFRKRSATKRISCYLPHRWMYGRSFSGNIWRR